MNTTKITALTTKFLGVKGTVYRLFKNGELVAQARFIPASITAATAIAAIGPAVAMIALQMQLGEISGLVRTNIQLTTQTLKVIRNEQWAELEGLAESVDEAVKETRELDAITARPAARARLCCWTPRLAKC